MNHRTRDTRTTSVSQHEKTKQSNFSVWCCEKKSKCKWQGFALYQGLAWGKVPENTEWRKWHDRECGGRLIQLLE